MTLRSLFIAVLLQPGVLIAQSPSTIIRRAVGAIGGAQALRGVTNQVTETNLVLFQLGQEETPRSPPRATTGSVRTMYDFSGDRYAIEQETRSVTGSTTRLRRVMSDSGGLISTSRSDGPDTPASVAANARAMRLSPLAVLRRALDSPGSVRLGTPKRFRGEMMDAVDFAGRDTATLYFDRGSGLLTAVETLADDPILGDRRTTTLYTRWQDANEVKLPYQIDVEINGRLSEQQLVSSATVNSDLSESSFRISQTIRSRFADQPAEPPIEVSLNEIAGGVWRAEGGTHYSLVVEQPNRLIVVEAPLSARRSHAVLDTLASYFPEKRVGYVVSTHHHWDHAGGLREYMAAGIPIVTQRRNVEFVREIATAKKTVAPDSLSKGRAIPAVVPVADSLTLGTGDSRVVLYRLPSVHAEGIIAAYVPNVRVLFVADVYSPGSTQQSVGAQELVAFATSRGLTIDRVVGAHGGIANWSEIAR